MNLANFGMDSITLAGPLESKLRASKAAGFTQLMLWAKDLASHPGGIEDAVRVVRAVAAFFAMVRLLPILIGGHK